LKEEEEEEEEEMISQTKTAEVTFQRISVY
jgi:hypothetical protein